MLSPYADASVLVVDDMAANVGLVQHILTRAGLRTVHPYTDPRQALAELPTTDPDLVLADLRMPHVSGEELIRQVAEHAAGAYLPVLVLTADASVQTKRRVLQAGAHDILSKPFDAVEVSLRVRNLLQTRYLYKTQLGHAAHLSRLVERYRRAARADWQQSETARRRILALLDAGGMNVVYQPIVDLRTGSVQGVEALSRFPGRPPRPPDVWFAEATAVGLGSALEILAVERAITALPALPEPLFLSVNVSPATMLSPDLRLGCAAAAGRLVLELTEHVPVQDYDALTRAVEGYRARGIRLAVDDAGAGYAGLRHLLRLRPDIIKLDRALTHAIHTDPVRRALASALVRFTADTGAGLIAEGIETAAEAATLRELQVPCGQGFHLARPQPLHQVLTTAATTGQSPV